MYFPIKSGVVLDRHVGDIRAVDGVSFEISRGETLGLVGESGCGKSTVGRTILRLYEPTAGRIVFDGRTSRSCSESELRPLRRRMQMVFQDPYASLNPRHSVGRIVSEPLRAHGLASRREASAQVRELLEIVGLRPMRRPLPARVLRRAASAHRLARAIAVEPRLVVARRAGLRSRRLDPGPDHQPARALQAEFGLTYLFIAHDLAMMQHISDRIAVIASPPVRPVEATCAGRAGRFSGSRRSPTTGTHDGQISYVPLSPCWAMSVHALEDLVSLGRARQSESCARARARARMVVGGGGW